MRAKRTAPKKLPETIRPAVELNELLRHIEEYRTLTVEVAQLICELQMFVGKLREVVTSDRAQIS